MTARHPRTVSGVPVAGPTTTSLCECGHSDTRHVSACQHCGYGCERFVAWNSARGTIRKTARDHDWTIQCGAVADTYRRGARYIRVEYDVRDSVRVAIRQTGSVGGRHISGRGKAERIAHLLTLDRWSTDD